MEHNFAIPLWALVDQSKIEVGKSDLRGLAKELGRWLNHNFDITHKGTSIELIPNSETNHEPILIVAGVPKDQWHIMIALAQSKDTQLFVVLVNETGNFVLRKLDISKI